MASSTRARPTAGPCATADATRRGSHAPVGELCTVRCATRTAEGSLPKHVSAAVRSSPDRVVRAPREVFRRDHRHQPSVPVHTSSCPAHTSILSATSANSSPARRSGCSSSSPRRRRGGAHGLPLARDVGATLARPCFICTGTSLGAGPRRVEVPSAVAIAELSIGLIGTLDRRWREAMARAPGDRRARFAADSLEPQITREGPAAAALRRGGAACPAARAKERHESADAFRGGRAR